MIRISKIHSLSEWFRFLKLIPVGIGFLPLALPTMASFAEPPTVVQEVTQESESETGNLHHTGESAKETIAGKTIAEYTDLLDSEDRTIRLRAAKSLVAFGEAAVPSLRDTLDHEDRAMRYVALVGLGDLAPSMDSSNADPWSQWIGTLNHMVSEDESPAVQMAAAYALCQSGEIEKGLPVLIDRVQQGERGMVCSAAELLGKLGTRAKGAIPVLEEVQANNDPIKKNGDYHKGGAAKNALRKVRGSSDQP